MSKKVIIIGAGIGGLSLGIRLLNQGFNVKILEKQNYIGGKLGILKNENFIFDLTASLIMIPKSYLQLFQDINEDYRNYLNIIQLDPIYKVFFTNNRSYNFSIKLPKLAETLECFSNKDMEGYLHFLSKIYKKYYIADKFFLNNSFINNKKLLDSKYIEQVLYIYPFSSAYNNILKYIKNKDLANYLAFQTMYVGISPFNGSSIYNLIPMISQLQGLYYIKGGLYSYVNALKNIFFKMGGIVETSKEVKEILINKGNAFGIKTEKEKELCDIVVCNSDFSYTMKNLIKDNNLKKDYTCKKLKKMKYSCSTFIMYLGLKKKYNVLNVHNIIIGKEFKRNIESAFKGYLPKDPCLYIYSPSRIDPSMCKSGYECLNVVLRVPNLSFTNIKWDEKTILYLRELILKNLVTIKGLEDLKENIIYENYLTPKDFKEKFNNYYGSAFGLSHTLTQSTFFRPQCKLSTIKSLYFVGDSIHPGAGVSMVLNSSKIASEEIFKDCLTNYK